MRSHQNGTYGIRIVRARRLSRTSRRSFAREGPRSPVLAGAPARQGQAGLATRVCGVVAETAGRAAVAGGPETSPGDFTWPTLSTEQLTGGRRCGRVLGARRRMGRLQHSEQLGLLRPSHALEELLHLLLLRRSCLLLGLPLPASDFLHEPFIRQPQLDLPPARRRGLRLLSAQLLAQRCRLRLQLSQRLLVAVRALRALCAWRPPRHVRRERLLEKRSATWSYRREGGVPALCRCGVAGALPRPAPLRTLRGQGEGLFFGVGGWVGGGSRKQCARRSRAA